MKIPLRYQVSEYDCGPTSLLNALNYLFQREEISPELIRNIMLYSLDCYGSGGAPGKRGTSRMAMMFLWTRCTGTAWRWYGCIWTGSTMCCSPGKRRDAFTCLTLTTCLTDLRKLK